MFSVIKRCLCRRVVQFYSGTMTLKCLNIKILNSEEQSPFVWTASLTMLPAHGSAPRNSLSETRPSGLSDCSWGVGAATSRRRRTFVRRKHAFALKELPRSVTRTASKIWNISSSVTLVHLHCHGGCSASKDSAGLWCISVCLGFPTSLWVTSRLPRKQPKETHPGVFCGICVVQNTKTATMRTFRCQQHRKRLPHHPLTGRATAQRPMHSKTPSRKPHSCACKTGCSSNFRSSSNLDNQFGNGASSLSLLLRVKGLCAVRPFAWQSAARSTSGIPCWASDMLR
mmetsp:Transcript_34158/g.91142  ORF Transcript_34158/g.91142 Transcript_34158/m.91142 type:complete len:284 (+) Transcript_34158:157-1008(+)